MRLGLRMVEVVEDKASKTGERVRLGTGSPDVYQQSMKNQF